MENEYTTTPCEHCGNKTEDMGYTGLNKRVQCVKCTRITNTPEDLELSHEVELALRDGLLSELITTTETGVDIIKRLTSLVTKQEESIMAWEIVASQLKNAVLEAAEQRDRARDLAVRLEQECHSCMDTVHHGNEEQYDKD